MNRAILAALALAAMAGAAKAENYYLRPNIGEGTSMFTQGGRFAGQVVPDIGGGSSTIYNADNVPVGHVTNDQFDIPGISAIPGIPQPF